VNKQQQMEEFVQVLQQKPNAENAKKNRNKISTKRKSKNFFLQ